MVKCEIILEYTLGVIYRIQPWEAQYIRHCKTNEIQKYNSVISTEPPTVSNDDQVKEPSISEMTAYHKRS